MATQLFILAKIGGLAGQEIAMRIRRWIGTFKVDVHDDPVWPARVQRQADRLIDNLREHRSELSVLSWYEWIDRWSMGDIIWQLVGEDPQGTKALSTSRYQLAFYSLPDGGKLKDRLTILKRRKTLASESLEMSKNLMQATDAYDFGMPTKLVLIREVWGASADGPEIEEALQKLPSWLAKTRQSK